MNTINFKGQVKLSGHIRTRTGLHIGAGKDAVEIGGIDHPVVKTPEGDPYIPGSSIKGKLRFLLEWAFGKLRTDGKPWGADEKQDFNRDDPILRIFGTSAKREKWAGGPTRLLVRDAMVDEAWKRNTLDAGRLLTEDKTEVTIDRIAGKALDKVGARQTERVPPGAAFNFEAVFRLYEIDGDGGKRDMECLAWLIQGIDLLEEDALGGSGSRGYGQMAFENLRIVGPGGEQQLDNVRKGHAFSREQPPAPLLKAVQQAMGG